ncbi:hypothetical protein HW932_14775 [Allochromatium humboldtianum]|uniref:Uncharacterized protein n=1 Tax=Allochromatium humboldtianum TaxID=504901 RepID=A0A850RE70_9GAMM|nr:hypothetical protein [Allochromatium humboldtianum]NCC37098.1 hypothetical protein [Chloroflexia bacterium]NVZ10526.1 hypothetical protein [Allochromatium humboldtianum]
MFSVRHWVWWNWLLAGILMPLLAGGLGLTIFIGLAVIALIARVLFGPAGARDPELDAPLIPLSEPEPDDYEWHEPYWISSRRMPGSIGSDFMNRL